MAFAAIASLTLVPEMLRFLSTVGYKEVMMNQHRSIMMSMGMVLAFSALPTLAMGASCQTCPTGPLEIICPGKERVKCKFANGLRSHSGWFLKPSTLVDIIGEKNRLEFLYMVWNSSSHGNSGDSYTGCLYRIKSMDKLQISKGYDKTVLSCKRTLCMGDGPWKTADADVLPGKTCKCDSKKCNFKAVSKNKECIASKRCLET